MVILIFCRNNNWYISINCFIIIKIKNERMYTMSNDITIKKVLILSNKIHEHTNENSQKYIAMGWIFVSSPNSYFQSLISTVKISGDEAFER